MKKKGIIKRSDREAAEESELTDKTQERSDNSFN